MTMRVLLAMVLILAGLAIAAISVNLVPMLTKDYAMAQLQDCINSNPYYPGCPLSDQYCLEQQRYLTYSRACLQRYGK
jgi:hypothetical protein